MPRTLEVLGTYLETLKFNYFDSCLSSHMSQALQDSVAHCWV